MRKTCYHTSSLSLYYGGFCYRTIQCNKSSVHAVAKAYINIHKIKAMTQPGELTVSNLKKKMYINSHQDRSSIFPVMAKSKAGRHTPFP